MIDMRNILFSVGILFVLVACQDHEKTVKDFLLAVNNVDIEKMSQFVADDFLFISGNDTFSKNDYLHQIDSLKYIENMATLLGIQYLDSVVKTEERTTNIFDSLFDVTPKMISRKTYRFSKDKIKSIIVDTIVNVEENKRILEEKIEPFEFWLKNQYDIQKDNDALINTKKYLTEYLTLPEIDRKKYKIYAKLQGCFVSYDNPFYKKLFFRGKETVSIITCFGFPYATSFVLDENYIRIRTDKEDLLFEIKDSKTLVGEGWAKGTYKKTK